MTAYSQPRFSLAPLLNGEETLKAFALRVGVDPGQIHRWLREGGIPFYTADKIANRCGSHPANVWGQEWWDACTTLSDLEADSRTTRWLRDRHFSGVARRRAVIVREADALENWRARVDRYLEVIEDREQVA